jgi:L-fuconolactonase
MKIDAHQHFWKYNSEDFGWIDDSMTVIKKDFLPESLAPILKENGFEGCVSVQVNQILAENDFMLKLTAENDFIKGIVAWVDLKSENLREQLQEFKKTPVVKGFRHVLQAEKEGFISDLAFISGVKTLSEYGFCYDILIFPNQLKEAKTLVKSCPENKFIIDHIAKPYIKDKKVNQWANYMQKIGELPNVMCKVSGMVTEADWNNWKKEDFYIYLDMVLGAFGTKRLVYGSDWPVCTLAAQYAEQLEIVESYFEKLSPTEKSDIFGGNAVRFYSL